MKPWQSFLQKYAEFGSKPTKEGYLALFDPEATLCHPGMVSAIGIRQIPDFIERVLERLPNFSFIPIHWAVNADTIFVEARNSAVIAGEQVSWPATYVITLRNDRVLRGRAYYDRMEVFSHFDREVQLKPSNAHKILLDSAQQSMLAPDRKPDPAEACDKEVYQRIVTPYVENWKHPDPQRFEQFYTADARMINPGFERPLRRDELAGYYAALIREIPDLRLRLESWAAAPGILFIEWTASGTVNAKPFMLGVTDRFTLRDVLVCEGVAYFDDLALRALADPSLMRFADLAFSGACPDH
jgi:ketosteroid isomerase-like protein